MIKFTKKQKNGTIVLFFFIILLQVGIFFKDDIFLKTKHNIKINYIEKPTTQIEKKEVLQKREFNKKETKQKNTQDKKSNFLNIDINSTNEKELIKIKGIGKVFSKRIIKFRNILGGFVSKEQFKKIYGLKDKPLENLINNTKINLNKVKTININTSSFKEILKHPYLKYEDVKIIFRAKNKGAIKDIDFIISKLNIDKEKKIYLKKYLIK